MKTREVGIIALRDTKGTGRADVKEAFGAGGGTGIAIRNGWLYHSTNSSVLRYHLTPGVLSPEGKPQVIVKDLPDEGQHNAKSFAFDETGRLLVEVGSPSNAYGDPDRAKGAKGKDPTEFLKTHGGFWRFDPAKLNQTQANGFHFSTGHRHILALAWNPVSKAFFVVQHGRDQLSTVDPEHYTDDDNAELPAEVMHRLSEGVNLGWPFTYYDPLKKARMMAPEFGGDNQKKAEAGKYPEPLIAFPAHWAPMQLAFSYGHAQLPVKYRTGAFIAFHGSWNRAPRPQKGFRVVFIPFDAKGMPKGDYETFADGFAGRDEVAQTSDARFRPTGVALGPDGSIYVTDSEKGRVWRIFYVGEPKKAAAAATPGANVGAAPVDDARGAELYKQSCAVCHMPDGGGSSGLQPPVTKSALVAGDASTLVTLLLRGPDAALPAGRPAYENQMPAFGAMSDADVAAVLSYVRRSFGNSAGPVTASDVAAVRAKP